MNPPIVVVGPQRSGTTIASKIIANDFNYRAVDESEFRFGEDYTDCVIQLPNALSQYVFIRHAYPGVQFVYIIRDKEDIIKSMKRVQWCRDDVNNWEQFMSDWIDHCVLQWHIIKQDIPDQCAEVYYSALQDHPLFIQEDQRHNFTSKQWQPNQPIGPRYWNRNNKAMQELHGCTNRITGWLQAIPTGTMATAWSPLPYPCSIRHCRLPSTRA